RVGTAPEDALRRALDARFQDKSVGEAVFLYWRGNTGGVNSRLQRVRGGQRHRPLLATIAPERPAIKSVYSVFQKGGGELARGDLEEAAKTFDSLLEQDALVMKNDAANMPSFFRRSVSQDMGKKSYEMAKELGQREDMRRACKTLK